MSGKLRQASKKFAASTVAAAQPLRWAVQVKTTTGRETTGLVEVERVGTGEGFWVQIRNSVYLAAGDLIWVVKDTSAQGNWIFDGFVTGGGTGESIGGSPIPSVSTPVVTAPTGSDLAIRPPAGQATTIGRVDETITFPGAISVAQGITFGFLGAGIVQSSAGGVLSSDYVIDATTTWATGTNVMPTDASGQALGDSTHRWDLYTQDVIFGGATGANVITVPDNLADALHLSDAGGIEYMRVISTDAQPIVKFNNGGDDVDFIVEAVGHVDALVVQGSDGQITLGVLAAGIVQSTAGGVLSSDYTIDSTLTMASGQDINPTDASGQDLGDATHRWDLYTQNVYFSGPNGANITHIPDNFAEAWKIRSGDGIQYAVFVTTDAQPLIVFNDASLDIDFIIGAVGAVTGFKCRGSDGQITLGVLTAGFVKSSAAGVLSIAADGLSGTLTLDDGANWRITLTFTAGLLTGQTTGATVGATATWV